MVIHSSSLLFIPAGTEIPDFDKVIAKVSPRYLRRIDRFANLALWGAIDCLSRYEVKTDTPMFLVSNSGGRSSMKTLKNDVITGNHLPAPYTFINTLTNSASFLIAKTLSLVSENIAISTGPNSFLVTVNLLQKSLTHSNDDTVLLGFVEEGIENSKGLTHYDYSTWFVVSSYNNGNRFTLNDTDSHGTPFEIFNESIPHELLVALKHASTHVKIEL